MLIWEDACHITELPRFDISWHQETAVRFFICDVFFFI